MYRVNARPAGICLYVNMIAAIVTLTAKPKGNTRRIFDLKAEVVCFLPDYLFS